MSKPTACSPFFRAFPSECFHKTAIEFNAQKFHGCSNSCKLYQRIPVKFWSCYEYCAWVITAFIVGVKLLIKAQCSCRSHYIYSFIHPVFGLATGPKPPPKWCLHIVRSRASSFKWEYPLLSLRSSSSFLRLLATSITSFIFPSIISFRRHFLHKM